MKLIRILIGIIVGVISFFIIQLATFLYTPSFVSGTGAQYLNRLLIGMFSLYAEFSILTLPAAGFIGAVIGGLISGERKDGLIVGFVIGLFTPLAYTFPSSFYYTFLYSCGIVGCPQPQTLPQPAPLSLIVILGAFVLAILGGFVGGYLSSSINKRRKNKDK